ncbi:MAG: hypothetical protein HYW33_03425 [Candidatus Blackburnbacteria bacterium]|nr:hypothetical protein [Candidatus Blackburnbacteria bacterium]
MTEEELKRLTEIVRPLKEMVEVVKTKISSLELRERAGTAQLQMIKDQQSVANEKLDELAVDLRKIKEHLGLTSD